MLNQISLKIGCVLITGLLIAMLVHQKQSRPAGSANASLEQTERAEQAALELGKIGEGSDAAGSDGAANEPGDAMPDSPQTQVALRVGKIASTPERSEIHRIQTLPMMESEIRRLYARAKASSCRMVTAGGSVQPNSPPPLPGQASTIGRVPSITVGLEMAREGRSKLPTVTRSQVDEYFRKHRLSIQPVVYADPTGQYYFGTDCQAAFFESERPGIAIQPEPMIESAVARFRSLGVFSSAQSEDSRFAKSSPAGSQPDAGRTLVMAFTFEKGDQLVSGVGAANRQSTELLFFHLPDHTSVNVDQPRGRASDPEVPMDVFITSDDRRTLNRLDLQSTDINSPMPTISADIRFDKMILLGMYPAEPVVTKIHYRAAGVVSMELVTKMMQGSGDRSSMSLSEILDQFALLSQSRSTPDSVTRAAGTGSETAGPSDASDESWYQEMSRRKYDSLNRSLQPIEKNDAPF
ncbi:hypothetical protein CA85_37420 [Allorhodopirellula solitaria]|uniref:Uncharacterized protein n=2 Tax=Allorhodopirellula solitaria TaxID=2527987 RepID=A0A5C5XPV7_9BACT|nr:hypothetical protein CA85_37420 [Allorhodopirellula solitaria]